MCMLICNYLIHIVHIYVRFEVFIWKKAVICEEAFRKLFNFQGILFENGFSKFFLFRRVVF